MDTDEEQLNLLSIFHYVIAVLMGLMGLFPVIHLMVGVGMLSMPISPEMPGAAPQEFVGWFFIAIAVVMMAFSFALAGLVGYAGACLGGRKNRTFCFVIAAIACAFFPFGTILGVFTLIVLSRPSVKDLFDSSERPSAIRD